MSDAPKQSVSGAPRHQRRLRNFLLDPHFQLKYSGYLMLIAVVLSVSLGAILWSTSQEVTEQSRRNVEHGEHVVALGREVVDESRKVSAVVQMNIVKDPEYSDNPALLEAFKQDAATQDDRLKRQQDQLVGQAQALRRESAALAAFQRNLLITLCVVLTLLVLLIGAAGIVMTHKVAGPIYKMKRQIREVGEGRLQIPSGLRKGDELGHFFQAFENMVVSLRRRQEEEIARLDDAIAHVEGKASEEDLRPLRALRTQMQSALDA